MDGIDRTMSREEYDALNQQLRESMRASLAAKRKYVTNEEASFAEEVQGERQHETPAD